MKINKEKLILAMADAGKGVRDLESISNGTYYRMIDGEEVYTKTVHRLAKELGIKVADLVEVV